jgi:hypothetical protein
MLTTGEDSQTKIKPLALASGHGRYKTVAPERKLLSVGEWPLHVTVIFFSVTVSTWIQKRFKTSVGTLRTSRKL